MSEEISVPHPWLSMRCVPEISMGRIAGRNARWHLGTAWARRVRFLNWCGYVRCKLEVNKQTRSSVNWLATTTC